MGDKWQPGKALVTVARKLQRSVASAVTSKTRKPWRPGKKQKQSPRVGGSFATKIRARTFVRERPSFVVVLWSTLGQKFLWFRRGTKKTSGLKGSSGQKKRPLKLAPKRSDVVAFMEADARAHFEARDKRESRRG